MYRPAPVGQMCTTPYPGGHGIPTMQKTEQILEDTSGTEKETIGKSNGSTRKGHSVTMNKGRMQILPPSMRSSQAQEFKYLPDLFTSDRRLSKP